jgi:medium-chain acyl-[acyl-carrier-protein] hydrolase
MPTTRTAYPRSTIAYDEQGQEVFRAISLWVLMDRDSRAMVLPGRSGVEVTGMLRGCELAAPGSMMPREFAETDVRRVRFSDLDINGHMNNCRYLDWVTDLLPGSFHRAHSLAEFTICYLSEVREDEELLLSWDLSDGRELTVEAHRRTPGGGDGKCRVFSARMGYENVVL